MSSHSGKNPAYGRARLLTGISVIVLLPSGDAVAKDWRLTPLLSLRQTYSDNISLGNQRERQDAFVSEVNPGLSLSRTGARSKFNLNYRLQAIFYEGIERDPQLNNQLQMNSNTELIDDSIFLDSSSTIGQVNTTSTGRFNFDNLSTSGNTTEFRTFRLSPYWRPHFGRWMDGDVRFSYGTFSTGGGGNNSISDSHIIQESVFLRNGDATLPFGWRATFYNQDQIRDQSSTGLGGGNVHFRNYNGEVSYRLSADYSVFLQSGMYENDFPTSLNNRRSRNGSYYTAGFAWTPSPKFSLSVGAGINNHFAALRWNPSQRTTLSVQVRDGRVGGAPAPSAGGFGYGYGLSVGDGFGGSAGWGSGGFNFNSPYGQLGGANTGTTWNGLFQHRSRHTTWSASYNVSTTTVQQLLFEHGVFTVRNPNDPSNPEDVILNPRPNEFPSLTDDIITSKTGRVSVSRSFSKNTLTLSAYQTDRTGSYGVNDQSVLGFTASWNWRLTQLMNSTLTGTWQQIDNRNAAASVSRKNNEYFNLGLIVNRQFSPRINGMLELRHFQQDGALGFNTLTGIGKTTENRITASVNVRF